MNGDNEMAGIMRAQRWMLFAYGFAGGGGSIAIFCASAHISPAFAGPVLLLMFLGAVGSLIGGIATYTSGRMKKDAPTAWGADAE